MQALQVLGPSTGGIRVHVATLAGELERMGVRSAIVGPDGVMDGLGPQSGTVAVPSGMSPGALMGARRALRPFRSGSQVVHAHGLKAAWVSLHGRPSRPLVVTVHNIVLDESAGRAAELQRRLERFVLGRADRVIAPTAAIAAGLAATVRPERLRTIVPASPIPVPKRSREEIRDVIGVGNDTPLVTCVARLHPQKDLPTLLHAFALSLAHRGDAHLAVVGDGPERSSVQAMVSSLGISESVHLVGFDSHAVDWIAAGDVFALSSVWEAIPLVLAEAMQLGVPTVSTRVGMAEELLGDGRAGSVVPVGDVDGLAEGLTRFLSDPVERSVAGSVGRQVASSRFDPTALSAEVLDVYGELVGPIEAVR